MNWRDYFTTYAGEPCSEERIGELEEHTGRRFPEAYRSLLRETGGGYVEESFEVFPDVTADDPWIEGFGVNHVLGNGILSNGLDNNLDGSLDVVELQHEWEIPDGVLVFALPDGGMDGCWAINYDLEDVSPGAVVRIDLDPDTVTKVADSFEGFFEQLGSFPDVRFREEERRQALDDVRIGKISPFITEGFRRLGVPGLESSLRGVGEKIVVQRDGFYLGDDSLSFLFIDAVFACVVTQRFPSDVEDFHENRPDQPLTFANLVAVPQEGADGRFSTRGYAPAFIRSWWSRRQEEGRLSEVSGGYEFTPEYAGQVVGQLRSFLSVDSPVRLDE